MDSKEIIRLLKTFGHMEEVTEIKWFHGYRKKKNGETEDITVKILDMGPDHPQVRYACIASSESGLEATGNECATLEETIAVVHWNKLD
jgi:hypothetical protein